MDEGTVRQHAARHAETLKSGNLFAAFNDLTDDAKAQLEPYVPSFPSPVERAEMVSLAPQSDGYRVVFEVSGGGRKLTLDTIWADVNGRVMITGVSGVRDD